MNAMPTSNAFMAIVNAKGNQPIKSPPLIAKPNNTAKIVWPAVMLANKRTANDTGLANWLTSSIGIISGSNQPGVPGGTRMPRNFPPWSTNPRTMLSPYTTSANTAVTINWLVTV